MRPYLILSVLVCLIFSFSFGQSVSSSKQIGYSEYPGYVKGYVYDKEGNSYALVNFTGSFSPDSVTTYSGNGGNDILLIKYNPDKSIEWAKNLGSSLSEYSNSISQDGNALFYDSVRNELLTLVGIISDKVLSNVQFANTTVQLPPAQYGASLIVKMDTDGKMKWIKSLTTSPQYILPGKEKIDLFFTRSFPSSSPINFFIGDTAINISPNLIQPNTYSLLHASIEQNGVLQSINQIQTVNQQSFQITNIIAAKDRFIAAITLEGDSLLLNNQKVRFTESASSNRYLFTIDTSFEKIASISLPNVSIWPQLYVEETDRIYCMGTFLNSAFYHIGGSHVPANNEQILLGFNRDLVLHESHRIAPFYVGLNYPIRRNYLKAGPVMRFGDSLYFACSITGGNEFTDANVPPDNVNTRVFFNHPKTFDLNGKSNAFIGHTDIYLQNPELHWIGEMESPNPSGQLFLYQMQVIRKQKLIEFIPSETKGTTRWQYDLSQNALITKDTLNTLDLADPTQHINVNTDGSYVIAGTSFGKLKIDEELNIKIRPRKAGIYFAGISSAQQTSWISRIESSYEVASLQQFERNGDKFYFYVHFSGPLNRQNFVKAGETIIPTGAKQNANILGYLDKNGQIVVVYHPGDENTDISGVTLTEFSFNENTGEVNALMYARELSSLTFFKNKGFPGQINDIIVRFDSLLNYKDARGIKITPVASGSYFFQFLSLAGSSNKIFLSGKSLPRSPYGKISMEIYKGSNLLQQMVLDTIVANEIRLSLIKLHWEEGVKWLKKTNKTTGSNLVSVGNNQIREGELKYMNNTLYMYFKLPNQLLNASYYWDNQLVSRSIAENSQSNERLESIVGMDTLGNFKSKLSIYGTPLARRLKKKRGSHSMIVSLNYYNQFKINEQTYTSQGFSDAVGLIIDSALAIRKSIRLHSTAQEHLQDFDFTQDTTILLAANIQKETNIAFLRTSNTTIKEEDLQEQSVIITYRSTMITPVPDTRLSSLLLYPNPSKAGFYTDLGTSPAGAYNIVVFDMLGRAAFSKKINWVQGSPIPVQLPGTVRKGMYFVQVKTAKGKNIHATKLLIE